MKTSVILMCNMMCDMFGMCTMYDMPIQYCALIDECGVFIKDF